MKFRRLRLVNSRTSPLLKVLLKKVQFWAKFWFGGREELLVNCTLCKTKGTPLHDAMFGVITCQQSSKAV